MTPEQEAHKNQKSAEINAVFDQLVGMYDARLLLAVMMTRSGRLCAGMRAAKVLSTEAAVVYFTCGLDLAMESIEAPTVGYLDTHNEVRTRQ